MSATKTEEIVIGTGRLTWDRSERISDRYGFVWLMQSGDALSETTPPKAQMQWRPEHIGLRAMLKATVVETRKSTHIGDLFRGVFPSMPNVGDVIVLGTGLLAEHYGADGIRIGLCPFDDDRETDWLDIRALYQCHEQTVILSYELLEENR